MDLKIKSYQDQNLKVIEESNSLKDQIKLLNIKINDIGLEFDKELDRMNLERETVVRKYE